MRELSFLKMLLLMVTSCFSGTQNVLTSSYRTMSRPDRLGQDGGGVNKMLTFGRKRSNTSLGSANKNVPNVPLKPPADPCPLAPPPQCTPNLHQGLPAIVLSDMQTDIHTNTQLWDACDKAF